MNSDYFEQLIERYLQGELSLQEEQDLWHEINQSTAQKQRFQQRTKEWIPSPNPSIDRQWQRLASVITPEKQATNKLALPHRQGFPWMAAAAVILILLIGGLSAYFYRQAQQAPTSSWEILVAEGKDQTQQLPDGSSIYLRAGAQLRYQTAFTTHRQVELEGEAFFEVQPDKAHPFVVRTPHLTLTVKGTSFSVSSSTDSASVVLVSGQVSLTQADQTSSIELHPNQRADYKRGERQIRLTEVDSDRQTAWRKGVITYENASLEEIVQRIEETYKVDLPEVHPADPTQRFTGAFRKTQPLEEVIKQTEKLTATPLRP